MLGTGVGCAAVDSGALVSSGLAPPGRATRSRLGCSSKKVVAQKGPRSSNDHKLVFV